LFLSTRIPIRVTLIQFNVAYIGVLSELRCMRLDAEWMTRADGRVLEFLSEEGPHPPSKMTDDDRVRFGAEYVGRRLRDYLVPYGLARNLGNGVYQITEDGEAYLEGELDAAELARGKPR
jgi:hypothetical protein